MEAAAAFIRMMKNPFWAAWFMLAKLPSAFFSGVRVRELSEDMCKVTVPYKWFSKNPFRSTYFACLSMAAEMSTGALAMVHLYKMQPPVSMLVLKMEARYLTKATGVTVFSCYNGRELKQAIIAATVTGEPHTFTAVSEGVNEAGEKVAVFLITWSFKARKSVTS